MIRNVVTTSVTINSMKAGSRAVQRLPEGLEDTPWASLSLPLLEDQEAQAGHGNLDHPAGKGENLGCSPLKVPNDEQIRF